MKDFTGQSSSESSTKILRPFIPAWVRDILPSLKGAAASVALAYWSHANKEGVAWPSVGALVRETGYGKNAVKLARKRLVAMGVLVPVEQNREGGRFGRKTFRVNAMVSKQCHGTVGQKPDHGANGASTRGNAAASGVRQTDLDGAESDSTAAHFTGARSTVAPSMGAREQGQEGNPSQGSPSEGFPSTPEGIEGAESASVTSSLPRNGVEVSKEAAAATPPSFTGENLKGQTEEKGKTGVVIEAWEEICEVLGRKAGRFGPPQFRLSWEEFYLDRVSGKKLTDAVMEEFIQDFEGRFGKGKIPGDFFDTKHVIRDREKVERNQGNGTKTPAEKYTVPEGFYDNC